MTDIRAGIVLPAERMPVTLHTRDGLRLTGWRPYLSNRILASPGR